MTEEKQLTPETKGSQKLREARGNVKNRTHVCKDSARIQPTKCVSSSPLLDQLGGKQAAVAIYAGQVPDAIEALPVPASDEETAKEAHFLARHEKRKDNAPPAPLFKYEHGLQGERIELDHPDVVKAEKLLMEALGTANSAFSSTLRDSWSMC
jgi:hypothetical protein